MLYLSDNPVEPLGFVSLSTSSQWEPWIKCVLPAGVEAGVRRRLISNLKHIIVGLEMKAGLIVPHGTRGSGRSVLFEPYCQIMTFEFCVGVFSVSEGLGSIHHLASQCNDGSSGNRVNPNDWITALTAAFDETGQSGLDQNVRATKIVRDRIHQDRLGLRGDIDWHEFGYQEAFVPALESLQSLLTKCRDKIPESTNLI